MIPVQLIIKGLYSYRKEQKIDFSALTDARLFGIFGGVGSGKSTILEAISFALYEQSERLNSKDRRNYNMMNLKSDELLIDFVFKTGSDEQEYRIRIETTRRKNKEEVNPFKRSTYKKTEGEWQAQELNIEEIIGLSYDNFKRTIIIPQGKFQDFLQLKESERVGMMKEIFQLERFDLSDRVQVLSSANKLKLENLSGRLSVYVNVTEEEIGQKQLELDEAARLQQEAQTYLQQCRKEFQELEKLRGLYGQIGKHKDRLKELDNRRSEFEHKEGQLEKYERFSRLFRDELARRHDYENQLEDLRGKLADNNRELETVQVQLESELTEFATLADDYQQRERYKRKADEVEIFLTIRFTNAELYKEKQLLDQQKEKLEKIDVRLEEAKRQGKELRAELDGLKAEKKDLDTLYQVKLWFEKLHSLQQNIGHIEADRQRHMQERSSYGAMMQEAAAKYQDMLPDISDLLGDEARFMAGLQKVEEKNKAALSEVKKQIDELNLTRKLEEYVEHLNEGNPCPLCGSTEHPCVMDIGANHSRLSELLQKQLEQEKVTGMLTRLQIDAAALFQKIHSAEQALTGINIRWQEAEIVIAQHREVFGWDEYRTYNEKQIQDIINKAGEQNKKEQLLQAELEQRREEWQRVQQEKELCTQHLNTLERSMAELDSKSETLKASLRELNTEKAEKLSSEELQRMAAGQRQRYELAEKNYRQKEQLIAELKSRQSTREGELKVQQEQNADLTKRLNQITDIINTRLAENNLELREVGEVLNTRLDAEAIFSEINAYRQECNSVKRIIEELESQTGGRIFDEVRYQSVENEVKRAEEGFDNVQKRAIELRKVLDDLQQQLSDKKVLEQESEKLQVRGDNLRLLANLFRANGFVNYISSRYLHGLCNAANEKFYKLTRQQLRLEISESNEFVVRDFMNNGRVRSVKTLSGGQTFQASLCLALALADSVQQQNKSNQNFFFLDEGFGSQDKESLYLVFEALKALRRENRIVGIISHVEELQQEIGVYLEIRNDEEEGSLITAGSQVL